MRCVLLRGACFQTALPVDHFDGFLVDIKVAASSHAINLSEALKRPERSFGRTTDSKASSFTAGSTRVYISVVCVFAWPSHSATFRRSFVACRKVKAQVCLRTCGCTRFVVSEGQCCFAVRTCLRRMYSKPERVKDSPRALTNHRILHQCSARCQDDSRLVLRNRRNSLRNCPALFFSHATSWPKHVAHFAREVVMQAEDRCTFRRWR
jgi:hypothetical protein